MCCPLVPGSIQVIGHDTDEVQSSEVVKDRGSSMKNNWYYVILSMSISV